MRTKWLMCRQALGLLTISHDVDGMLKRNRTCRIADILFLEQQDDFRVFRL